MTDTEPQTNPPASTADNLADQLLTRTHPGALTVLDGHALTTLGGWAAFGTALSDAAARHDERVLECQFGDDLLDRLTPPHDQYESAAELSRSLAGDNVCAFLDWDHSRNLGYDEETDKDFGELAAALSPFGTPSVTALARTLALDGYPTAVRVVVLLHVASARPYAEMLRRQRLIPDPADRDAAIGTTHAWLAHDLAAFAVAHPRTVTLVALDHRDPEWDALAATASTVLRA